jgi:hypothetical protein
MRLALVPASVLILLSLQPVLADHCTAYDTSVNDFPEGDHLVIAVQGSADTTYIASDQCQPDCIFHMVLYQETNDLLGLQRADARVSDICHGLVPSDTLLSESWLRVFG